jgi:hypothetical protein
VRRRQSALSVGFAIAIFGRWQTKAITKTTVRSVAEKADPFIKRRLLQLAQNYERRIGRRDGDDIRDEKKRRKKARSIAITLTVAGFQSTNFGFRSPCASF